MRVRDIMSWCPYTVRVDKPALAVDEIMLWAHVRHVPVVDADDNLVGIVSQRDLLRIAISELDADLTAVDRHLALAKVPVRKALTVDVTTIDPGATIQDAARLMHDQKIGSLPVVEGDRLLGIVTEHDLLRELGRMPLVV